MVSKVASAQCTAPITCTSSISRQSSTGMSRNILLALPMPALFTTPSTGPSREASFTASETSFSDVMSTQ